MKTILIVDDRAENRDVIVATLTHRRYRLLQAASGKEALKIAREEKPNLILADILMPKMDGFELVRRLRSDPAIAGTQIIFYTASYIGEEARTLAKACGVEHVLVKPVEPEDVLKTVDLALSKAPNSVLPEVAPEFERKHLHLVTDKLAQKVEELEKLNVQLEHEIIDRKNAQETFEKLRKHHELILNSAGEGIHGLDVDGTVIFENPKAAELLGWPVDDLLGHAAHTAMHHTRADGSKYAVEDCPIHGSMRDGGTRRVTNDVFWRKDGSSFHVDYVAAPIKDENGHILGTIVTFKDITEQFFAEARQKMQAEQYRLLFEANPNPMYVFATKTLQILAANRAAITQYGYTGDEFLNLTLKQLRPSEDVPDLLKALSSAKSPTNFSGEFRHKRKDGSVITVEVYSASLSWEGVAARLVTAIDVTERKQAEEELIASQQLIQGIINAIPVSVFWKNRNLVYLGCNAVFAHDAGVTDPSEIIGKSDYQLGWREQADRYRRDDREIIETGRSKLLIEEPQTTPEGKVITLLTSKIPLRNSKGEISGVIGVYMDITERKRAEARIHEQANIIQHAHDAVIVRGFNDDIVTVWNEGAERLYGWSAAEAIGRPMGELIVTEENIRQASLEQLVSTGEHHGEITHRAKGGREVIVETRATLVRNEDGTPQSILGINTNITEQKKLEKQLLRTQRLESIGTLASGVAHDLNNILVPILMAAPILRNDVPSDEREKFLNIIESSAQRGASIVKQVLTFARGASGDRVLLQPTYLLGEITKIAQETFPKSIRMRTTYPEDVRLIEGDPTQLHQVLLNLCVNARDAMPEGGTLTLSCENFDVDEQYATMTPGLAPGPHVLISVIDTGTGIPEHITDKIFDPFFTTKEPGKGTGLGLSTALGIVKSHGGIVSVYTNRHGTTFRVLLPSPPSASLPNESTGKGELPAGHGETILVVDDESPIREVATAVLSKSGYNVLAADDGPAALALFVQRSREIDVVLTDTVMPVMSGLILARTLRKMDAKAKVIVSSARDADYDLSELKDIGVQECLAKPYTREALLRTIDRVLHNTP